MLAHVGTYNLKVIGTLGSWGSATILVTVQITIGCADTTITPDPITTKTYQVTDPALTFTFNDWASSVTLCGAFSYSSTFSDNTALNSAFISLNSATKTFTVSTSNPAHISSYSIKVSGTLADGATSSTTFTLNIVNPCASAAITPPATITPPIYYIFGSDLNFVIPAFT